MEDVDKGKRTFLKAMGVLAAGAAVAGVVTGVVKNVITQPSGLSAFPTLQIVNSDGSPLHTNDVPINEEHPFLFYYPLDNDPNFLLRLSHNTSGEITLPPSRTVIPATGQYFNSPGGVGPHGNVVAYSAICQHLGCVPPIIHYYTPGSAIPGHPSIKASNYPWGVVHCNCHGSTYDPSSGAHVITGPTSHPLPNVILEYDSITDTYKVKSMVGPVIYGKPTDLEGGTPFPSGTKTTPVTELSSI
ncbi:MAG: Rieske 2Fe-2S domain-containing protein [Thermoplasmataceae archaeon]|jgi:Rieske Fe-S protein